MGKLADRWTRLTARRLRVEKPEPGVDWAEGALANGVRVGEWRERIGGGDRHGHTSQLSAAQLDDLTACLETL